ncbi:putative AMP binding enzyme [Trypanosoma vivax]|uniref:Putative fatty acyl CoA synthetase n=1 Tax=Trypanosoma vivax (strain Y486) TaxID=1055687 RepID=G0U5W7_TRYVY|nr:putative fatty acyl CoA synthetase [Trypanosoma vivax]KAH8608227.1 putative AMP binding enzyme [Trypanosoma vivax]CCC51268.1 putative fatty acyl CoA synthetase [Trypanosoma vivax Y486]
MGGCVATIIGARSKWDMVDDPRRKEFEATPCQIQVCPGTEKADASAIYRMSGPSDEEFKKTAHDIYHGETATEKLRKACMESGEQTACAYRVLQKIEKTTVTSPNTKPKVMDIFVYEPKRRTLSYNELWKSVNDFSKGLREIGLDRRQHIALYEETRWEWYCSVHAIWLSDMIAITVYANLGEEALIHALKEAQCVSVVCNGKSVEKLIKNMKRSSITKAKIIYLDSLPDGIDTSDFELYNWNDVVRMGAESSQPELTPPTSENCDDTALIMYTSGTTGNPKGVIHTHGSLASAFYALNQRVLSILGPFKGDESYCSYLPLAHIMELAVLSVLLLRGTLIGFGNPRTLTDTYARPHGDFSEYRPQLLVGVPRIFDSIKKGVEAMLQPRGSVQRTVFDRCYQLRLAALKEGKDTPYLNNMVFSRARKATGGRLKIMLSGGGPLSPATHEFITVVFCPVVQGWGLTETSCCGAIQLRGHMQWENVGQLINTVEVRLLDTPQYRHTDTPEPRGEILMRGPSLFKGYHMQPEETKAAIDSEGWFHTGDVGSISENGTLRIVGRVKALAKNSNGEYLALEVLEAAYGQDSLCAPNGVCVLVHPNRSYIAALVTTNEQLVVQFAKKHKINGTFPEILGDPIFREKATTSFQETARRAGRKSFEVVRHVRVLADEWTPENDALTAAMKLKRRVIDERYKDIIAELFQEDI